MPRLKHAGPLPLRALAACVWLALPATATVPFAEPARGPQGRSFWRTPCRSRCGTTPI